MATPTAELDTLGREITEYITAAVRAGVPEDQLRNFTSGGYIAQPFQLSFHAAARAADKWDGPNAIAMGGARGPGKSHAVFAQIALDDCQRQPGLKVLFLRKVKKSATESFADLTGRILRHIPHQRSREQITFPNGSRILIGGYKDEQDIDKYLGIEYDIIAIEEVTQLTWEKRLMIEGSKRTSLPEWRTRMYFSTNPGGIGHAWFKDEFVIPFREGTAKASIFIPGTYRDNKYLDRDYIIYLESLPGNLGKAWRDGDWEAFEGMAFPLWNEDVHVVKRFDIPEHWLTITGIDYGFASPWCALYVAIDPNTNKYYVFDELYGTQLTTLQQCNLITQNKRTKRYYADPALWTTKEMEGRVTTTADEYKSNGVYLERADNNRLGGKRKIDNLLGNQLDGEPGIYFMENCKNAIRTIPALPSDPVRTEDVDTRAEDHAYDALRYALTQLAVLQPPKHGAQQVSPLKRLGGIL